MRSTCVPDCMVPLESLSKMKHEGAKLDMREDGMYSVEMDDTKCQAWETYKSWVCSLGDVAPGIMAVPLPDQIECPPLNIIFPLLNQVRQIVAQMFPLTTASVQITSPICPAVPIITNVPAPLAVTLMLDKITDPGPLHPLINGLQAGCYICHLILTFENATLKSLSEITVLTDSY